MKHQKLQYNKIQKQNLHDFYFVTLVMVQHKTDEH